MEKYTPGQWYQVGAWVEHEDDDVADICSCDPATIGQEHIGRSDSEMKANARLIAATPDLLEALQNMVEAHRSGKLFASTINNAVDAITKATGESK